jgi:hypothetical protein
MSRLLRQIDIDKVMELALTATTIKHLSIAVGINDSMLRIYLNRANKLNIVNELIAKNRKDCRNKGIAWRLTK